MKFRILAISVSALLMQAIGLYDNGMYERARSLFETVSQQSSDPVSEGYMIMCDIKMKSGNYQEAIADYDSRYGRTAVSDQMHYLNANSLFDEGQYAEAAEEYGKVKENKFSRKQVAEINFKKAYSQKESGNDRDAIKGFEKVDVMYSPEYAPAARYALGDIYYNRENFTEAFNWFKKSAADSRFEETANYYMIECRFMQNDYKYVTDNAEAVYKTVPAERKPHLARIISEAYLVQGNTSKAKEYFDRDALQTASMTRSDYFYAGSLQYALGDYQDAISNFSMMPMRTDSIGQIANYQLGYSYIKSKNKVSALTAFKDAAALPFDAKIQEDAYFNYAKLAFDLNHDASVFTSYLDKYASSKKGDQIYGYMALTSLYNRNYAEAVEAYDNIDELDPSMRSNYMKANYLRAQQLIGNGSYKDAIPYLRAASFFTGRQDNFNKLSRYWLAESYYMTDNFAEAKKIFEDLYNLSALDNMPEGKSLSYDLAYCYLREDDFENAAKWFDIYLTSGDKTNRKDAFYRRGDCDFVRRDYNAAIKSYSRAEAAYNAPNDIYPYYQLGLSYGLAGKNADKLNALSKVKKATNDAPYYNEAMYELGRTYVDQKKLNDAYICFQTLKASTSDSSYFARSLIELGMISSNQKKYEEALDFYKAVISEMPSSSYSEDALVAVESIYQTIGEPDKYLAYIKSLSNPVSKTAAETEMIYFNSAEQMFLSENYSKALTALDNYVRDYPDGSKVPQAFFYIAESYKALGQKEKACEYYSKVAEISEGGSFAEIAILNYANISYSLEHFADAYGAYDSLLDKAQIENNKFTAEVGMMRSAFKSRSYSNAIRCADVVKADNRADADVIRETDYIRAMSYLATSQREVAYGILRTLSKEPATDEGAEASYLVIQDMYDQGNFDEVEPLVYKFSEASGNQAYWLAKAFIVLGDSFMEKGNVKQAKATFESVQAGYEPQKGSTDDVLDNVRMRLNKIKDYE